MQLLEVDAPIAQVGHRDTEVRKVALGLVLRIFGADAIVTADPAAPVIDAALLDALEDVRLEDAEYDLRASAEQLIGLLWQQVKTLRDDADAGQADAGEAEGPAGGWSPCPLSACSALPVPRT